MGSPRPSVSLVSSGHSQAHSHRVSTELDAGRSRGR